MDRVYVDGLVASIDAEVDESPEWWIPDGMRWRPPEVWDDNPPIPLAPFVDPALGIVALRAGEPLVDRARRLMHQTGCDGWAAMAEVDPRGLRLTLFARRMSEQMTAFSAALVQVGEKIRLVAAGSFPTPPPEEDAWERALRMRRERNTGPPDARGLDGVRRRG